MVQERLSRERKKNIAHLLRRQLAELDLPCDVLLESEEEVEEKKGIIGSVVRSALQEGRNLKPRI